MDGTVILSLSSVVVAMITAGFAFVSNTRVARSNDRKVDAEAFNRAQRVYSDTLKDVESQLRRLRQENAELISANQRLQKQLNELEILVIKMRRIMMEQGISPDFNFNGNN